MAYVKGSLGDIEKVKEYTDGLEGRVDSAFKDVDSSILSAILSGWNIEWGRVNAPFSSSGYFATRTTKKMSSPQSAVVLSSCANYSYRKATIAGWTVGGKDTLVEFYLHDEKGSPISGNVDITYVIIYK